MVNTQAITASFVGAVIGGVVGYLVLTEDGRTLRREVAPALEDLVEELTGLRSTVQKVAGMASDSWRQLTDSLGESERTMPHSSRSTSAATGVSSKV